MNKHALLLAILLLAHSLHLEAQPRDPNAVKNASSKAFNQKKSTRLALPYKPQRPASSGAIDIFAVVVGIGNYSAMPRLQYTDDDARLFYDHLQSYGGGALPDNHIQLLINEDATLENIVTALQQASRQADANDVLMFYFSGHGISGAFLPVDFDGFTHQLRHEEILEILARSRAKQKLCIADACFSGAIDEGQTFAAKGGVTPSTECFYDAFEQTETGTALLMSSNPGEASLEDRRLRHGVFTYFLMRGMNGAADFNHNRIVTIQELYHYAYHYVAEYTEGVQTPVLAGDYDNRMPVAFVQQDN